MNTHKCLWWLYCDQLRTAYVKGWNILKMFHLLFNLVFTVKKIISWILSKQIVPMTKNILNRCYFFKYEYNEKNYNIFWWCTFNAIKFIALLKHCGNSPQSLKNKTHIKSVSRRLIIN